MSREFYHPVYTVLKKGLDLLPIRLALVDTLLVKSYGLYNTVGSALSACVVTYLLGGWVFLTLSL